MLKTSSSIDRICALFERKYFPHSSDDCNLSLLTLPISKAYIFKIQSLSCNDKRLALSSFRHRVGGTYGMGVCPGQAPIAIDWFCLLRVKVVPSEEDSPSCGVLVDIFQSVNAIRSAIYAFLSKSPHRQFLKIKAVVRINSAQQVT